MICNEEMLMTVKDAKAKLEKMKDDQIVYLNTKYKHLKLTGYLTDEELDAEEAKELEDFLKENPKLKDALTPHNGPWHESDLANSRPIKNAVKNVVKSSKRKTKKA